MKNKSTANLDKVSWERKFKQMQKIVTEINEVEDKIMDLQLEKMEKFDKVQMLRLTLIETCIHPANELTPTKEDPNIMLCKFCGKLVKFISDDEHEDKDED